MDRRAFLGSSLAAAGGMVLGGSRLRDLNLTRSQPVRTSPERLLDRPAAEAPIDTVVVVMLENRSFDHLLGWMADDHDYLEEGKKRHGADFHVIGSTHERYRAPDGKDHPTRNVLALETVDPLRGCSYHGPGHTWKNGRVQRDDGFLAQGSGNDDYAITYFDGSTFPGHRAVAEHFTVLDRYHASLLGPTFPNRQYLHSAQSEGRKSDPGPLTTGIYKAETIWDRLAAAGVPATYYYTDLPLLRLWGTRMKPYIAPLDQYFEQAATGTLPRVSMLDPSFTGPLRADAHPQGNVFLAVAFFAHVLDALMRSPQWSRSMFVLAHDEWGGFYDHVPPPVLPDDRSSHRDADNFGQAGFRAAAALISPYAAGNAVDHTVYDHTSILRFLEWRFLGAPASGPGRDSGKWWLTKRDRFANPLGQTLLAKPVSVEVPDSLVHPGPTSGVTPECAVGTASLAKDSFETDPSFEEERARDHPEAIYRPWEQT
jgi:phospholipase C